MTIPGIYSQRDARWSGLLLGYNTDPNYNIYHYGCAITALANILWWNGNAGADPGAVNNWLKDHGGFEPGGGILRWDSFQELLDQVNMVQRGYSSDLAAVNSFLQDENAFAIAWITKPGFPMHFSAMPYVGKIGDSWDGALKSIGEYTFHGAHLYSKNNPVIPAPTPEPVPEPAPVVAPTPDVPSNPEPQPEPDPEATPIPIVVTPVGDPTPEPEDVIVPEVTEAKPVDRLKSRKLWLTIFGYVAVLVPAVHGYITSGQAVTTIGFLTTVYVAVQGLIDHAEASK